MDWKKGAAPLWSRAKQRQQELGDIRGGSTGPTPAATHLATQEATVPELAQEEGNEEGPKHEDEGQQSRVGLVPGADWPVGRGQGTPIQVQPCLQCPFLRGVERQQWVLREHLCGLQGGLMLTWAGDPDHQQHTCEGKGWPLSYLMGQQ